MHRDSVTGQIQTIRRMQTRRCWWQRRRWPKVRNDFEIPKLISKASHSCTQTRRTKTRHKSVYRQGTRWGDGLAPFSGSGSNSPAGATDAAMPLRESVGGRSPCCQSRYDRQRYDRHCRSRCRHSTLVVMWSHSLSIRQLPACLGWILNRYNLSRSSAHTVSARGRSRHADAEPGRRCPRRDRAAHGQHAAATTAALASHWSHSCCR